MSQIYKLKYSEKTKQKLPDDTINFFRDWDEKVLKYRANYKLIYTNGKNDARKVALTFDDAPDADCTPQILDILKEMNVKASFSVVGLHIEREPQILRRIYDEKHDIINHTYFHPDLSKANSILLKEEIKRTEKIIYDITGFKTRIMRPPYGKLSTSSIEDIRLLDYKILLWSYDTFDYVAETSNDILDGMTDELRAGEIILLHSYENKEPTVKALNTIISELRNKGIELVPASEILGIN